jgi:hypothetical protein
MEMSMSKRTELLSDLARQALAQYDADLKAGGEPVYPLWATELLAVLGERELLVDVLKDALEDGDSGDWQSARRSITVAVSAAEAV